MGPASLWRGPAQPCNGTQVLRRGRAVRPPSCGRPDEPLSRLLAAEADSTLAPIEKPCSQALLVGWFLSVSRITDPFTGHERFAADLGRGTQSDPRHLPAP